MLRFLLDNRFGQHLDFLVHGGLPDFGIKIKAEFQAIAYWLARTYPRKRLLSSPPTVICHRCWPTTTARRGALESIAKADCYALASRKVATKSPKPKTPTTAAAMRLARPRTRE